MKKLILSFVLLATTASAFCQAWTQVGNPNFSKHWCTSVKLASFGNANSLAVVADPDDNNNRYIHPYVWNGTSWSTFHHTIKYSLNTVYLNPDIEMNSVNEFVISTRMSTGWGTLVYKENISTGKWDQVDSISAIFHEDMDPGNGGDLFISGNYSLYKHDYVGQSSTSVGTFPVGEYARNVAVYGNNNAFIATHDQNNKEFRVSKSIGVNTVAIDSVGCSLPTIKYSSDIVTSNGQPVSCHLNSNGNIEVKKYNGATWSSVILNNSRSYTDVSLNMGVNSSTGDIYVGVSSVDATWQDSIRVFEVTANLSTQKDLGSVATFPAQFNAPSRFDVEVISNAVYIAYLNHAPTDSSKVNVKKYDLTTGIHGSNNVLAVNVFPNPTNGIITIDGIDGAFEYQLTTMLGQNVIVGRGNDKMQLDLTNHKKGLYLLTVSDESGKRATKRIVVN